MTWSQLPRSAGTNYVIQSEKGIIIEAQVDVRARHRESADVRWIVGA